MDHSATNVILFDDPLIRLQLLPFTYTRPVAGIRCGIHTITEKWNWSLNTQVSFSTEDYLSKKYPLVLTDHNLYINGAICPDQKLLDTIHSLEQESVILSKKNEVLVVKTSGSWQPGETVNYLKPLIYEAPLTVIRQVWHITGENGAQIKEDFGRISRKRESVAISDPHTRTYSPEKIFLEEGVHIKAAILNAENGPIYIGKNATIGEGSTIQGPFSMGEGAVLSQGTKIRPGCTIGPFCKAGGEINNSVLFGNSNKSHDGYLGNSVLGYWCNLGANTNNSNLKNDYSTVKLFNYASNQLEDTEQLFCGAFIGDYTKTGISTMLNTGTVIGVHANVFGSDFQPKHIPSFSWGGKGAGISVYRYDKALSVIKETMRNKGCIFSEEDESILWEVFERTMLHRSQNDIHSFRNEF